jgi:hypothetical protein
MLRNRFEEDEIMLRRVPPWAAVHSSRRASFLELLRTMRQRHPAPQVIMGLEV